MTQNIKRACEDKKLLTLLPRSFQFFRSDILIAQSETANEANVVSLSKESPTTFTHVKSLLRVCHMNCDLRGAW